MSQREKKEEKERAEVASHTVRGPNKTTAKNGGSSYRSLYDTGSPGCAVLHLPATPDEMLSVPIL